MEEYNIMKISDGARAARCAISHIFTHGIERAQFTGKMHELRIQTTKISHKITQKCAIFHIKIFSDIITEKYWKNNKTDLTHFAESTVLKYTVKECPKSFL